MVLILAVLINKAIDSQRWSSLNKVEMPEIPWYDIEERIQTLRWRHAKMYLLSVSCHPPPTTTMSPNKSQKAFPLPKVCVLLGWDQYRLKNEEMVNMWVNIQNIQKSSSQGFTREKELVGYVWDLLQGVGLFSCRGWLVKSEIHKGKLEGSAGNSWTEDEDAFNIWNFFFKKKKGSLSLSID